MNFRKHVLSSADQGYSISRATILGSERIIAASESTGPAMVFAPPEYTPRILADGPGGCMGFAPIPGRDDMILMITEFYPIFKSEKAGIHLYKAVDGLNKPWKGERIIELPFVHRITTVEKDGRAQLVAATVCGGKDFQDDWSRPGTVYAADIPADPDGPWQLRPVMENLHKNHGMNVGVYNGKKTVFITGTEGCYAFIVPGPGEDWNVEKILDGEISEVCPFDLDGDGVDELAVIEPFHGTSLSVYKDVRGAWTKIYEAELAFGHGSWAGEFGGERVVFAGNRDGSKDLVCHRVVSAEPFTMEELVVDKASGTTNMDVVDTPDGKALATSNPEHAEYALYYPSE